ncbi:serum response factor-binding protein 1 [Danaus plexippus]|uniref:serum response factor-binding protein 1 n=1 Tax=Danaus plexippus TaxID=13037 RepID=UPI002AAFAB15|nr:serum response factor-binding protein 1 [Danaus plexippus]
MEVGAVKQAFNNEIILLKKNLNQAKTQTIHKLTRKAKQLVEKKAPDEAKEKLKRKAESAVKEVLILKKIKPRDIAQFIVTHKGALNEYMNKPVDKDKACARLLLHKAMQDKYKLIREKFSNVSIKDLFMSRQERLKLKKEAREKQNSKKDKNKAVNIEGEWNVEAANDSIESIVQSNDDVADNMSEGSDPGGYSDEVKAECDLSEEDISKDSINGNSDDSEVNDETTKDGNLSQVKSSIQKQSDKSDVITNINKKDMQKIKKPKENKNKNLNKKLQDRKFHKVSDDDHSQATRVVDPFFITSSGENYMSLVEPRQPDEIKEVHKQGNRKFRRAVMFGHVPKPKVRKSYNDRYNDIDSSENNFVGGKTDNRQKTKDSSRQNGNKFDRRKKYDNNESDVPEKLHPSWEAKKKQSSILPFQGKKIVFDES